MEHPLGADAHEYLSVVPRQTLTNDDGVIARIKDEQRRRSANVDVEVLHQATHLTGSAISGVLCWRDFSRAKGDQFGGCFV